MKFDMVSRVLVLETKDCTNCTYPVQTPQGTIFGKTRCLTCKGSGRGPRGKVGGCRVCSGRGTVIDFDPRNAVPCPVCNGAFENSMRESFTDAMPNEVLAHLPLKLGAANRENTFNENFLGMGTLFSVTDYGDAANLCQTPEGRDEFLAGVQEKLDNDRTQACKVTELYERGASVARVCDFLQVTVTRSGWAVRPGWEK